MARFGPLLEENGVTFRLWAPAAKSVDLILDKRTPMTPREGGWFQTHMEDVKAGTDYAFRIDDELNIPDPASRFQPRDVHGPSRVIDPSYNWKCTSWRGRPWHEAVISEVHVGTFSPAGNYRGLQDKLDHFVKTGITAIELMPLSDFPGRWNWGYDGVLPFAPDSIYGEPQDLKALIDAAHERDLMVFLDVVYNHFGPEGNYLHRISPEFFSDEHTPWGNAIDYTRQEVRDFAIENVQQWVRDYRFDGLRFDAVHAITEPGTPHILHDISRAVGDIARESGRLIHLVLENDDNQSSLLSPVEEPPARLYRAQWNDDFHHAMHVALTGETHGYYKDYEHFGQGIARSLSEGFIFQGEPSKHRDGKTRGEPSGHLSPLAFVNFIQNHDQIGNRAMGERLASLASEEAVAAALKILLLSPAIPLLFMGEEWGAREPFPFFCDFNGGLADGVREGRKREFAEAYARHGNGIPDPLGEDTVKLAALDWAKLKEEPHRQRLDLVRQLLAIRRNKIAPMLCGLQESMANFQGGILHAQWAGPTGLLVLLANLHASPQRLPKSITSWPDPIFNDAPRAQLEPWAVHAAMLGQT